jgi:hypothetical protein
MKMVLRKALKGDLLEDNEALEVKSLYPTWRELVKMGSVESDEGFRFQHNGKLYKCIFANPTFQANWVPGSGTESLYTRIDETHAGSLEDPIPYEGNMALTSGLYYSQGERVYICNRDTGIAVFNLLSELVGIYVQVVS